jgi:hypothetical protein
MTTEWVDRTLAALVLAALAAAAVIAGLMLSQLTTTTPRATTGPGAAACVVDDGECGKGSIGVDADDGPGDRVATGARG